MPGNVGLFKKERAPRLLDLATPPGEGAYVQEKLECIYGEQIFERPGKKFR